MKRLFLMTSLLLTAGLTILSCSIKDQNPKPKDPRYFSFEADGVPYKYEYECSKGLFGGGCNMGAFQTYTTGTNFAFQIYAEDFSKPVERGEFRFFLNKDDFQNLDTIVLDGRRNFVEIYSLNYYFNNYYLRSGNFGRIIFENKNDSTLLGRFEFNCSQQKDSTLLEITNGEFFVRIAK